MKMFRSLAFGSLALLTLATAVGCGQPNQMPTGAVGAAGDINAASKKAVLDRTFDFDWEHYKKDQAPKAHKTKMPRQALLPSKVDLREFAAPVYNQGNLGACTAFAMGKGMREMMARQNNERAAPLSALFLYYEERALRGTVMKDSGATITDGMKVLSKTGIAPEETWKYDSFMQAIKFRVKPPSAAYKAAGEYKVAETFQLDTLDDVRSALAQGHSVPFGFLVYRSIGSVGASGVLPMPQAGEQPVGGHAVLAVGYDDQKRQLIVRNSWGGEWGDHGYFYMPYDYVSNKELADDFWYAK